MCFIGDKRPDVVELAPLPVAQVGFLDGQMSSQPPADLGLVHEPNVNIEHALTPTVIDKIDNLAVQSGILLPSS